MNMDRLTVSRSHASCTLGDRRQERRLRVIAGVSFSIHETHAPDDEEERRRRLLFPVEGTVLAHRLERPPAAESDEYEQR
jgi:hypothetical protein